MANKNDSDLIHKPLPITKSLHLSVTTNAYNSSINQHSPQASSNSSNSTTKSKLDLPQIKKKIGRACDNCKKRKQRCDGLLPCSSCVRRNKLCEYTSIDRRLLKSYGRKESKKKNAADSGTDAYKNCPRWGKFGSVPVPTNNKPLLISPLKQVSLHGLNGPKDPLTLQNTIAPSLQSTPPIQLSEENRIGHFDFTFARNQDQEPIKQNVPSSLRALLSFSPSLKSTRNDPNQSTGENKRPEHKNNETEQDTKLGQKLFEIGDSSALSYLLGCRKVFENKLGRTKLNELVEKLGIFDSPPVFNRPRNPTYLPSTREYAFHLNNTFVSRVNNFVYIIHPNYLHELINRIYSGPYHASPKELCILNLVFAVASQYCRHEIIENIFPFHSQIFIEPSIFYEAGVTVLKNATEEPKLWFVEAHLLKYIFNSYANRRNSSWLELGIAIRTAQALGLHKRQVNELSKVESYLTHRRILYRSLFILDRLSSAALGRAVAIDDTEWDDHDNIEKFTDIQSNLFQAAKLLGEIIKCIYFNPKVSLNSSFVLLSELIDFSIKNPIPRSNVYNYSMILEYQRFKPFVIALHGIILLARPFYHITLLQKIGLTNDHPGKNKEIIEHFYENAIKASLLAIQIIGFITDLDLHPIKSLSLVHCLFQATLILGSATLLKGHKIKLELSHGKEYQHVSFEALLLNGLKNGIRVLRIYDRIDSQSTKFIEFLNCIIDITNYSEVQKGNLSEALYKNDPNTQSFSNKKMQEHHKMGDTEVILLSFSDANLDVRLENIKKFQYWLWPLNEGTHIFNRTDSGHTNTGDLYLSTSHTS
ncbi:hypothetical protein WICMUC_004586 [Wickerhamomyces mucosus]|uniref:Zn(2)-C6 fungal-type domain-containing protein n=1 Tax=Wickerhamomyces mucosus TaxID=1378264 RepID=A0A9P8PHE4_9ASCO|nr:hypothetical protein WICMUC_004586 [Wickerhamomyces mucosus]